MVIFLLCFDPPVLRFTVFPDISNPSKLHKISRICYRYFFTKLCIIFKKVLYSTNKKSMIDNHICPAGLECLWGFFVFLKGRGISNAGRECNDIFFEKI